jgi:hypothetical protein
MQPYSLLCPLYGSKPGVMVSSDGPQPAGAIERVYAKLAPEAHLTNLVLAHMAGMAARHRVPRRWLDPHAAIRPVADVHGFHDSNLPTAEADTERAHKGEMSTLQPAIGLAFADKDRAGDAGEWPHRGAAIAPISKR